MSNVKPLVQRLLAAVYAMVVCVSVEGSEVGTVWATATATRPLDNHRIVYRFIKEFAPNFDRSSWPERVILVWRYKSTVGMPSTVERESMDRMEDLLSSHVEKSGLAVLALVSTGENLREWTYYTKSEEEFVGKLNAALGREQRFPIEVHIAPDPQWSTYEAFRRGVKE